MARFEVCHLCDQPDTLGASSETADVRSNVRAFRNESFIVWRCSHCRSVHARDEVDLARYYRDYPMLRPSGDLFWRLARRNYVRRLERAGLRPTDSVLDYGCGAGSLLDCLRARGYRDVHGYDAHAPRFNDRRVLEREYDCVVIQDVIEHVDDPRALMAQAAQLTHPGGRVCIGTPNAARLDLTSPDDITRSLHQPYHRHILSGQVLRRLAQTNGLSPLRWYDTYYTDLAVPFANLRFALHYAKLLDNTMDLAFERRRFHPGVLTPRSLVLGCFGRFAPPRTEMMAVLQKSANTVT